jgi:hypothetical protein
VSYTVADLIGENMELHPVLQGSADEVVSSAQFDPASGTFTIPGRTTVVYVIPEEAASSEESVAPEAEAQSEEAAPSATEEDPSFWAENQGQLTTWGIVIGLLVWVGSVFRRMWLKSQAQE